LGYNLPDVGASVGASGMGQLNAFIIWRMLSTEHDAPHPPLEKSFVRSSQFVGSTVHVLMHFCISMFWNRALSLSSLGTTIGADAVLGALDGVTSGFVGASVCAGVDVGVGASVCAGVDVGVGAGVCAGVDVGVGASVCAGVDVCVGSSVCAGVDVGVGTSVCAGVEVCVGSSVCAGVDVGTTVTVDVGSGILVMV
jgi:hypothetical protein